uniref:Decapping nuclease n=1 Tax=Caenorhabditis tropicalis TaxID=1561998 RepID=A0A1I7UGZ6_9PELO
MESLLEYIHQKPWTEKTKPHFVTNKQLLKAIASSDILMNPGLKSLEVRVVRISGVIFILKSTEEYTWQQNFGAVFEHFMTKETENEEMTGDGIIRKAVFIAEIPMENKVFKVMYSGEIDAIDEEGQHYELKVLSGGMNSFFWEKRSCSFYWQCYFSNVETMIVGSRTGRCSKYFETREPPFIPEFSLYEIRTVNVNKIPETAMKKAKFQNKRARNQKRMNSREREIDEWNEWEVKEGEERLQKFLQVIHEKMNKNGDCFKFLRIK